MKGKYGEMGDCLDGCDFLRTGTNLDLDKLGLVEQQRAHKVIVGNLNGSFLGFIEHQFSEIWNHFLVRQTQFTKGMADLLGDKPKSVLNPNLEAD